MFGKSLNNLSTITSPSQLQVKTSTLYIAFSPEDGCQRTKSSTLTLSRTLVTLQSAPLLWARRFLCLSSASSASTRRWTLVLTDDFNLKSN